MKLVRGANVWSWCMELVQEAGIENGCRELVLYVLRQAVYPMETICCAVTGKQGY